MKSMCWHEIELHALVHTFFPANMADYMYKPTDAFMFVLLTFAVYIMLFKYNVK